MRPLINTLLLITITATSLFASGAGSMARRDPHDEAVLSYNDGIRARDRAWKLETELASAPDPQQKATLEEKIRKSYQAAVRAQRSAIRYDPTVFQAWGELGYALRKTGDYAAALEAYDKALTLRPNYAEAIEYRGEAYLGLNRIADARDAYLVLFNGGDPARAKQLADAMTKWLDQRRADPAGVAAETIDELAKWIAQRQEISAHTAGATTGSWK